MVLVLPSVTGLSKMRLEQPHGLLKATNQLACSWYTPRHKEDHSSFHSKLAGIVGVLHTLSFCKLTYPAPFWLACDRLLVVTWLLSAKPIKPTEPHADLLGVAQALLHSCGNKVELTFICGHQDSGIPMVLALDTLLNIEADALAKAKASTSHLGPTCYRLPRNVWACYASNCWIVKQFDDSLWSYINGQESQWYWEKRKVLHPDILSWVDWSAIGQAMKSSSIDWWCWVSKQMSRYFAHRKIWFAGSRGQWWSALNVMKTKKIRPMLLPVHRRQQISHGRNHWMHLNSGWNLNNQTHTDVTTNPWPLNVAQWQRSTSWFTSCSTASKK